MCTYARLSCVIVFASLQHHFALWAAFPEAPRATDCEKYLVTAPDAAIEREHAEEVKAARAAAVAGDADDGPPLSGFGDDSFDDGCDS